MTKKKHVAKTLTSVLEDPAAQALLDRTSAFLPAAERVASCWKKTGLFARRPRAATDEDGTFVGTDLDLSTFLLKLVDRGAVINIPRYRGRKASEVRSDEYVISNENRHGRLTGLFANKDVFSFGLRVLDLNVVKQEADGSEKAGAPRSFSITNARGEWFSGWDCIEFHPSREENEFIHDRDLLTENKIYFTHFVHPNRWTAFYGRDYFLVKTALQRGEEELKHLNSEVKRLKTAGVKFPVEEETRQQTERDKKRTKTSSEKSETVTALEVEVDLPEFIGEYPVFAEKTGDLVEAYEQAKQLRYNVLPKLRFAVRSVELAFFKHGHNDLSEERLPAWVHDTKWERNFTPTDKRTKWNRLVLFQPEVGKFGVAVRYRLRQKTERVRAD